MKQVGRGPACASRGMFKNTAHLGVEWEPGRPVPAYFLPPEHPNREAVPLEPG